MKKIKFSKGAERNKSINTIIEILNEAYNNNNYNVYTENKEYLLNHLIYAADMIWDEPKVELKEVGKNTYRLVLTIKK